MLVVYTFTKAYAKMPSMVLELKPLMQGWILNFVPYKIQSLAYAQQMFMNLNPNWTNEKQETLKYSPTGH